MKGVSELSCSSCTLRALKCKPPFCQSLTPFSLWLDDNLIFDKVGKRWWSETPFQERFFVIEELQYGDIALRNWKKLYWPLMDWQTQREGKPRTDSPELPPIDNGWMVCFVRDRGERNTLFLSNNLVGIRTTRRKNTLTVEWLLIKVDHFLGSNFTWA